MQRKPTDVGNGVVCASFGTDGSWLSVGAHHPRLGLVELTGAPPFPERLDGDGPAVREHRARLVDPSCAMLRVVGADAADAAAHAEAGTIVQEMRVRAGRSLTIEFSGRLARPGYAEITPVGPIPPGLPPTLLRADGPTLEVSVPGSAPPVHALVTVTATGAQPIGWVTGGSGATARVSGAGSATELRIAVTMDVPTASPRTVAAPAAGRSDDVLDLVGGGAERYTLGCTALEVADGRCCIVTDHRLLPLSWTRDAYYQAALLLARQESPEALGVVERHLAWLWGPGRDESGVWQRSHLTTGAVKDPAYQADQQLYPLLELADFRRVARRWPATHSAAAWGTLTRRVWSGLPRDAPGLLPGEENPADDPSDLPYLLSSQLLLTYTARRLAEWEDELQLADLGLADDAARSLAAIRAVFGCDGPYGAQWAYETDGQGTHRRYHDANDVPTALAPVWGLCAADDPRWLATMRFAWSPSNPGYVPGVLGGLGSAHTPGVWPLGDAQEWAVAMTTGDEEAARRVLDRISRVVSDDGMLPETYDPETGDWLARHWFGWPGALVGLVDRTLRHGRGPWVG
ncbi:MAG: glycoside hydrolase family 125 protein [Nocardioidaceae bacterium]